MFVRETGDSKLRSRFFAASGPLSYVPRRPEAAHLGFVAYGGRGWAILIPHWLMLLAVGSLWLGLLFWRVRRRKRSALA
jgi:hypothetical protein